MIYISSSCAQFKNISGSVEFLSRNGFKHIELSGGTSYYPGLEDDLLDLKKKNNLSYLIHNYFPPPKDHFVLNLASLNDDIYKKSLEHYINAIRLAQKIGADKYGLHAGYFIDPEIKELGRKFDLKDVSDKTKAIERFCEGFEILKSKAGSVNIYIENNVISSSNYSIYGENILMLTNFSEYLDLKKMIDFNLLLDVGHLKVSSNTLSLDFSHELKNIWGQTNYIHLSDNNGLHDSNDALDLNSRLLCEISKFDNSGKTFTIEVYRDIEQIISTYQLIKKII
jgi:sugar phosphate isomerase/epimerase